MCDFPLPPDTPSTRELDNQLEELAIQSGSRSVCSPEEQGEDLSLLQSPLPHFGFSFLDSITNHWNSQPYGQGGNKLGAGAFGSVYYGQLSGQLGLENSSVAVKRLSRDTPDIERLFNTEVEMMGLVDHPHLLRLLAYSSDGTDLCLLYPFMEGGSLQERLACRKEGKPPLAPMQRLRIARGCAEGLQYLHTASHTKPLVHRDVKTSNILLDNRDEPKVGDFGLARLGESTAEGRVVTVMTEMVVGTSAYMAPEAYKGDVGPKMDVFSLGVVMLELLTGLPPLVEGEEARDIVSHLEEEMGEGATIEKCLDTRFSLMEWRQVFPKEWYAVAEECIQMKKKLRPDMDWVVERIGALFH